MNSVDVMKKLSGVKSSDVENSVVDSFGDELKNLKNLFEEQRKIVKFLAKSIQANATTSSASGDRVKIIALNRRVQNLETKVNNLTSQLAVDHCKSFPCLNGGTCSNIFNGFRCDCPVNFEGLTCNNDVDECRKFVGTSEGCLNGATCVNSYGSYQ